MSRTYAGIGSRETPPYICIIMQQIAQRLAVDDWCLRSGGAVGADKAFEDGAKIVGGHTQIFTAQDATSEAMALAAQYHPNWGVCNEYARKLLGRNAMILLGPNLNEPVKFVVCWSADELKGGTGHALAIARAYDISVRNLCDRTVLDSVVEWLGIQSFPVAKT